MNKVHERRLRNVIRALEESPNPKAFTMSCFVNGDEFDYRTGGNHFCGTPACALGHYAARRDLQREFRVITDHNGVRYLEDPMSAIDKSMKHFGLRDLEFQELFGAEGCGDAKTTKKAIRYIEKFIERKKNGK